MLLISKIFWPELVLRPHLSTVGDLSGREQLETYIINNVEVQQYICWSINTVLLCYSQYLFIIIMGAHVCVPVCVGGCMCACLCWGMYVGLCVGAVCVQFMCECMCSCVHVEVRGQPRVAFFFFFSRRCPSVLEFRTGSFTGTWNS